MHYPSEPEPHTIEIEATNYCSARCSFCPHSIMTRKKGFLNVALFKTFIRRLGVDRERLWLFSASRGAVPRVVFAGLGEPTLHPNLPQLVEVCSEQGFRTQVVTNGAHLTEGLVRRLSRAGMSQLAVSLHSLNPVIYQSVMRLPLSKVLPRINMTLEMLAGSGVAVELWRVLPPPGMPRESAEDMQRFEELIARFPWVKVLGPSEPWSRDGTVADSAWPVADDSERGGIWCHRLFFTHNVAWDGTAVMCCVDYNRISVPLGNVFSDSFEEIRQRRAEILRAARKPAICQGCRRWQDFEYDEVFRKYIKGNP
jgi:MoaA/NifB/PqqE/SkfB family radical SAM enzyme